MSGRPDFSQPPPKVQTLAEAQALIEALWEIVRQTVQQVEALQAQVAELQERLGVSSRNSSQPPSQDGPGTPQPPLKKKSGRPRGDQKGHPGHARALLPPEQVDNVVECRPAALCACGAWLPISATPRWRHQVTELPEVKPQVAATALWMAFCTTVSRGQAEAKALLGECVASSVITDRYSAYHWLALARRQIGWVHLLRDFERIAGRVGAAGGIGRWLRAYGQVLFRWHPRYQKGELDAATYHRRMQAYAVTATPCPPSVGARGSSVACKDRGDLQEDPSGGARAVDLCDPSRGAPDEQCGGAGAAPPLRYLRTGLSSGASSACTLRPSAGICSLSAS